MSENTTQPEQPETLSGGCLCGAVRFSVVMPNSGSNSAPEAPDASNAPLKVGVCHCFMCRRSAGGSLFAIGCEDRVTFSGDKNITVYRSSNWGARGFCKVCGANLFYRIVANGDYIMCAGAFDDQGNMRLVREIFIDDKPEYYSFAQDTHKMTGAEFMAQFTG